MYLCLCGWGSSNQLPPLASQAAGKTGAPIRCVMSLSYRTGPSNSLPCFRHFLLSTHVRRPVLPQLWAHVGRIQISLSLTCDCPTHTRRMCSVSSWVKLEGVTYNSCLFPGRLSVEHKDRLYVMFQEGERAEEDTCQGATEKRNKGYFT